MFAERRPHRTREVLGLSPRRSITPRRSWSRDPAAARRQADAAVKRRIEQFLVALRRAGRRSILIADADCGDGRRLIDAANRAHALGFVVIDARGYDKSHERIAAVAKAALVSGDPDVRFGFALLDESSVLALDAGGDDQADLMLASAKRSLATIADTVARDGLLIRHR